MSSADGKPPRYASTNSAGQDMYKTDEDYTYEWEPCPECGYKVGHALTCRVVQAYHPPAHECNAPGTRVALDAAHARIAALEAERDIAIRAQHAFSELAHTTEAERDKARELVGALLNWLHEGAGEDSPEYQHAMQAVGLRLPSLDEFIADIRRDAHDYTQALRR